MIEHLIKAATCRVVCGTESGTAWLIGKDRVVTARHCVLACIEDGQPVELFFPDAGDGFIAGSIVAQSEDWDACLLALEATPAAEPLSVSMELPREGETWQTFGYPQGKPTLGHRLTGNIAQVLETPKLKIDLDLSIDTNVEIQAYGGMSGAAVICEGSVVGMVRLKVDGTVAALSLKQLETFLAENGVDVDSESAALPKPLFAERGDFPEEFAESVQERSGCYLFLEGAHGYGKSTFCRTFRGDEEKLINLGAFCLSDPESALAANYRSQPAIFLDWLTTKICGLITGHPPRKEEKSYPEQIRQTSEYLDK